MTILKIIYNCGALVGSVLMTYLVARIVKLSPIPGTAWERWGLVVMVILWGISSFLRILVDLMKGIW